MYARKVDRRELRFGVSGLLWNASLVMYDKETNSLWSHILGTAQRGPLKGKQLESIPCAMSDWESWSRAHPNGSVALLSRTDNAYTRDVYRHPARYVLGIADGDAAKAWSFETLSKRPIIEDISDGEPVVVIFDARSTAARLFKRQLGERLLSFELVDGKLKDRETGTTWDPISGRATAGPLAGESLTPLTAIVSFARAWKTFHPAVAPGGARGR